MSNEEQNSAASSRILQLLGQREAQCRIERRALEMWLGFLTPLRWFTVSGGVVFSGMAGTTALLSLFGASGPLIGGLSAFAAMILTGLHTALRCDAHQAECRRLIQLYTGLATSYQAARAEEADERAVRQRELEGKFQDATLHATAAAPAHLRSRAEKEVTG